MTIFVSNLNAESRRTTLKLTRAQGRFQELEAVPLPSYKSEGAAGLDLHADVGPDGLLVLAHRMAVVPCGFHMEIPPGFYGQVCPRSGIAFKALVTVVNSPGIIDSDYRGEVMVGLMNHSDTVFRVARGDRIAQLVITPFVRVEPVLVKSLEDLSVTERGVQGFGSTGVK